MSNWIKWCKGLARKREVMVIACKTGMSPREVAGTLMEIWEWADDNTEDGHVLSVTSALLAVTLGVTPEFIDALKLSEWLVEHDGGIEFPNYMRHNAQTAKNRLLAAERQKRKRDKSNGKSNDPSVTKALPDLIGSDLIGSKKSVTTPKPPKEFEYSQDFEEFWKLYPKKKAKGDAYKRWKKLSSGEKTAIMGALPKHVGSYDWTKDGGQFIPHPATWMNKRCWEDEVSTSPPPSAKTYAQQTETGQDDKVRVVGEELVYDG